MSKKRIYYEEGITAGLENMMKQPKYNPGAVNISDQASYSDSYASILNGMLTNATNATNGAIRKGRAFSPVDAMKAQIEYASTIEERAYNEYLYNQYESPAAMVRQYEEAGLNPMMLAGGSSVGGSVNSTSNNSMSLGRGTDSARGLDIMSLVLNAVMGAAQFANQTKLNDSEIGLNNANARVQNAEADVKEQIVGDRVENQKLQNNLLKANANVANMTASKLSEEVKLVKEQINNVNVETQLKKLGLTKAEFENQLAEIEVFMKRTESNHVEEYWSNICELQRLEIKIAQAEEGLKLAQTANVQADTANKQQELDNLKAEHDRIVAATNNLIASTEGTRTQTRINKGQYSQFYNTGEEMERFGSQGKDSSVMRAFSTLLMILTNLFSAGVNFSN